VAILAEGLVERLDLQDLEVLLNIERDAHDNIRLAEVNFGEILKFRVQEELQKFGIKSTIVAKNIGYELRCSDPIPFDMEYTRDLGYCAAQFLLNGGNKAMISVQEGRFVPIYFNEIIDPITKRTKVRMVDTSSEYYQIARRYMLRLSKEDFDDPHELAKYAATAGISLDAFKKRFYYIAGSDVWGHTNLDPAKFIKKDQTKKIGEKKREPEGMKTEEKTSKDIIKDKSIS